MTSKKVFHFPGLLQEIKQGSSRAEDPEAARKDFSFSFNEEKRKRDQAEKISPGKIKSLHDYV